MFSENVLWGDGNPTTGNTEVQATATDSTLKQAGTYIHGINSSNAELLNITAVVSKTADGSADTSSLGATQYCLWFTAQAGATATVSVLGTAYQDLAGNPGTSSEGMQVGAKLSTWHRWTRHG